jgi:L-iditol 2-dehydrogenase
MAIKAAVMTGPNQPIEMWELENPTIEPGGILLETVASEVCGTDVHLHHGRLAGVPYPIIPGHISVGRIIEANGVDTDAMDVPIAPGDLVTFYDVHETCHACYYCTVAKQPNRCPSRRVYGITYSANEGPLGGWAERIYLKPGVQLLKLPQLLTAEDVIGGGCGLFTGFAAVERSDLELGDTVLVQGTGPVGLSAIAFAALRGAGRIIAIGDPEARLQLADVLGADLVLSVGGVAEEDRAAVVKELTNGRGVDVAIECAGHPTTIPEGFRLLRDGGTYVIAGHYTDVGDASINPHIDINKKHADVRGRWGLEFSHLYRALLLLAKNHDRLPFANVIGQSYTLEQANEALADVEDLRVTKAIIRPQ